MNRSDQVKRGCRNGADFLALAEPTKVEFTKSFLSWRILPC